MQYSYKELKSKLDLPSGIIGGFCRYAMILAFARSPFRFSLMAFCICSFDGLSNASSLALPALLTRNWPSSICDALRFGIKRSPLPLLPGVIFLPGKTTSHILIHMIWFAMFNGI